MECIVLCIFHVSSVHMHIFELADRSSSEKGTLSLYTLYAGMCISLQKLKSLRLTHTYTHIHGYETYIPDIAGLLDTIWSVWILMLILCSGGCSSITSDRDNILSASDTGFILLVIDNTVSAVKKSGGEGEEMNINQIVAH